MTQPTSTRRRAPATLADMLSAEFARTTAGEPACGDTCSCHDGLTCARLPHSHTPAHWYHPDGPTVLSAGSPAEVRELREAGYEYRDADIVAHATLDANNQVVQWVCTDPAQRALTPGDHNAARKAAKVAHASALRAILDYDPEDD